MADEAEAKNMKLFNEQLDTEKVGDGYVIRKSVENYSKNVGSYYGDIEEQIKDIYKQLPEGIEITGLILNWPNWPTEEAQKIVKDSFVYLRKIYLIAEPNKDPEYSIWLEIRNKDDEEQEKLIQKFPIPASIKELYLKIWNTKNKQILMEIEDY